MPSPPRPLFRAIALLVATLGVGVMAAPAAAADDVELVPVVEGLRNLVGMADLGGGRLLVYTRQGSIFLVDGGEVRERRFLDLRSKVGCCEGNEGLVGLALHPEFDTNGQLFVSYTNRRGDSIVSRFTLAADPDRADRRSEKVILEVPQPGPDHNLGHLAFGPDGYLYIGSGDGAANGDPEDDAQSLDTLLGKILRIDVDSGDAYAIPPDNPFAGDPDARPEIWAYGLRNPWRFSFDRQTGELFIGDVGANAREEINLEPAASGGGRNYGWNRMEGSVCGGEAEECEIDPSWIVPILEYPHEHHHDDDEGEGEDEEEGPGCAAVIGGHRYRGPADGTLAGLYLYGDLCSGQIWGARPNVAGRWTETELFGGGHSIRSFAEDRQGRLWVVAADLVARLEGRPLFASDFEAGTRGWSRRRGGLRVVSPGLGGSGAALEVRLDGTATPRFLRSNEPDAESTFRAGFTIDLDRPSLGDEPVEILRLVGRGPEPVLRLLVEQAGRRYRLLAWFFDRSLALRKPIRMRLHPHRETRIELEWLEATGPAAIDGQIEIFRNGQRKIRVLAIENHGARVGAALLGLPAGAAGAGPGAIRIDDYTSSP